MQVNRRSTETTTTGVLFTLMAISIVVCTSGCGSSSAPNMLVPPDPAISCAGIAQLSFPNTRIAKAELVPANVWLM